MVAKSKTTGPSAGADSLGFDIDELLALARIDLERNNLSDALLKLKQVVAAETAPAEAFSMTGRLYAQLGLWDRAQKMLQKFLELEPKAVAETFQLGMVHFDAGRRDEAAKIWDDLLKKQPGHPPALFYRALLLAQNGQIAQARQSLDALIKSIPVDNLYFGRAKELLQNLDAQQPPQSAAAPTAVRPKDAYKTEH